MSYPNHNTGQTQGGQPSRGSRIKRYSLWSILGVVAFSLAMSAVYTIDEGHVGIIKRWGEAIEQVDPGLHVKVPIMDTVVVIEVRQRKNVEELSASTQNQLPIAAKTSINWTVNRESAIDLFRKYGGLQQFEERILDPKLRSVSKAALAMFPADVLIRDRQAAVEEIMVRMVSEMEGFPVTVNSPQLENVILPDRYVDAVLAKEQAREEAEREKHALEKQRLEALQTVNTAQADAEAYRTLTEATAEAEAIDLVNAQLAHSAAYVDLVRAKNWDGVLPVTVLSDAVPMFGVGSVK